MREFSLYINVAKTGKLNNLQLCPADSLLDTLSGRRINIYWIIEGKRIGTHQIINIIKNTHLVCKKKDVIIHNEICIANKTLTPFAKVLLRHMLISTYCDKREAAGDYASLRFFNQPTGCMFNSCLGNTIYLAQSGELSLCPYATEIKFNPINPGTSSSTVFDTADFKSLLIRQIQKRNRCKNECQLFNYCHGGCPIRGDIGDCFIRRHVEQQNVTAEMKLDQEIRQLAGLYRG